MTIKENSSKWSFLCGIDWWCKLFGCLCSKLTLSFALSGYNFGKYRLADKSRACLPNAGPSARTRAFRHAFAARSRSRSTRRWSDVEGSIFTLESVQVNLLPTLIALSVTKTKPSRCVFESPTLLSRLGRLLRLLCPCWSNETNIQCHRKRSPPVVRWYA